MGVVLIASGKLIAIDFSSPNPISVLAPGTPPRRFWRNHWSCSMLDLPHTGLRLLVQTVVRPCVLCATGKLLKILIFLCKKSHPYHLVACSEHIYPFLTKIIKSFICPLNSLVGVSIVTKFLGRLDRGTGSRVEGRHFIKLWYERGIPL